MSKAILRAAALGLALGAIAGCGEKPPTGPADAATPACPPEHACGEACCGEGQTCDTATRTCVAACVPQCAGRNCGDDGCGGTCGACAAGMLCGPGQKCIVKKCEDTGGSIPIEDLCSVINGSFRKWNVWQFRSCGVDVAEADVDHLDALIPIGYSYGIMVGAQDAAMTCSGELNDNYAAIKASVLGQRLCYDSKAVDECIAAGKALAAQGKFGAKEPDVCKQIFVAAQSEGDECQYPYECRDGLYCRASDGGVSACTGVCSRPLPVGTPCTERDSCATDTACAKDGSGKYRCLAEPGDGAPCRWDGFEFFCAAAAYCEVTDEDAHLGTCRATRAAGTACTEDLQCADGLSCLPGEGGTTLCATKPALGVLGDTCGGPTKVTCDIAQCLHCDGATATAAGACKTIPKAGEACRMIDTDSGPAKTCDRFGVLECDTATDTCRRRPREGERCVVTPDPRHPENAQFSAQGNCLYLDNYCERPSATAPGACTRLPVVGEPCFDSFNSSPTCGEGVCKGRTSTRPGTCSKLGLEGADCAADAECSSGFCPWNAAGGARHCARKPGTGQPCGPTSQGASVCDGQSWCDTSTSTPTCMARKAAGEACTYDAQCASTTCGKLDRVCVAPCGKVTRTGCWDGLDWFSKYIFVSGAVGLIGARRRRSDSKDDAGAPTAEASDER